MIDSATKDRNGAIKLTKQKLSELVAMSEAGESRVNMARAFGVSARTISAVLGGNQRASHGVVPSWRRVRRCPVCSEEFTPKMPWQATCSSGCTRRKWHKIQNSKKLSLADVKPLIEALTLTWEAVKYRGVVIQLSPSDHIAIRDSIEKAIAHARTLGFTTTKL